MFGLPYLPSLVSTLSLLCFMVLCLVVLVVLSHFAWYFYDPYKLRRYPGFQLAKISDLWLVRAAMTGKRSLTVHQMHKTFGPIVRIAPNHISIASPPALQIVYAHGNSILKSNFYDAFVSIRKGIFNTRDREEHTRKRKLVSHVFSQKNVVEFESHIQHYVGLLMARWDGFLDTELPAEGPEGEGWRTDSNGVLWLDMLPWVNYLAFDIIGDLAFGSPFNMVQNGRDEALAPSASSSQDLRRVLASYSSAEGMEIPHKQIPAIKILTDRGAYSSTMGLLPPWMRPLAKRFIPWFTKGCAAVDDLAGIAVVAVKERLEKEKYDLDCEVEGHVSREERVDLLSKLRHGKDGNGNKLTIEELTAEALTLLIAGSDTLSNTMCAILYYIASDSDVQNRIIEELHSELGPSQIPIPYQAIRRLSYLSAVIYEAIRLHSTSSIGLPRVVPAGGLTILGEYFLEGTILSVPSYTLHRDPSIWGEDAEVFRPERWFEGGEVERQMRDKAWNGFSFGPRGCVGKNLAMLELQIVIASLISTYEIFLEDPESELETSEGFLRKPMNCRVGVRRRREC